MKIHLGDLCFCVFVYFPNIEFVCQSPTHLCRLFEKWENPVPMENSRYDDNNDENEWTNCVIRSYWYVDKSKTGTFPNVESLSEK